MEKYTILLYETLKQAVEVKADNEEDAIDQVRAWRAQGMLKPGELAGLDFDMLDVQPLRDEPLQRFEILGQPALFTDMDKQEINWLQGTEPPKNSPNRHRKRARSVRKGRRIASRSDLASIAFGYPNAHWPSKRPMLVRGSRP